MELTLHIVRGGWGQRCLMVAIANDMAFIGQRGGTMLKYVILLTKVWTFAIILPCLAIPLSIGYCSSCTCYNFHFTIVMDESFLILIWESPDLKFQEDQTPKLVDEPSHNAKQPTSKGYVGHSRKRMNIEKAIAMEEDNEDAFYDVIVPPFSQCIEQASTCLFQMLSLRGGLPGGGRVEKGSLTTREKNW
jgi:hypothetical protein